MNKNSLFAEVRETGRNAKLAARELACLSGQQRQNAIAAMPEKLRNCRDRLFQINREEVDEARKNGLPDPLVKRLSITDKVFSYMTDRLKKVSSLRDPLNRVLDGHKEPGGLQVQKISVPIGVIGIIYESRPSVTTDAASVCLKSGNAVILRGGSETLRTNMVLVDAMTEALKENNISQYAIQMIRTPGHEIVSEILKMDDCIDVLIPRGGKPLIQRIAEGTRIPVIKHYEGVCHLYLAKDAPLEMAVNVAVNSKCQRVEVCNALETLLIDKGSAERLLPELVRAFNEKNVTLRGCKKTRAIVKDMAAATEEDWFTEYLAPILSVRIVEDWREAVEHISIYGSGHTDGIITEDLRLARHFIQAVDSASVLVNASTRLSGGGDYGMGAVVGISTDKIHARGPVGPEELTSYKWVAYGEGHIRS